MLEDWQQLLAIVANGREDESPQMAPRYDAHEFGTLFANKC